MKCPNCGNTEKFEMMNNGIKTFSKVIPARCKALCLHCGYKFSSEIEKRYDS